jgi:TRAP-type C4-dicarboxylate transport system permease small subunit
MVRSFVLLHGPKNKDIFSYCQLLLIALYCVGTIHGSWFLATREYCIYSDAVHFGLLYFSHPFHIAITIIVDPD